MWQPLCCPPPSWRMFQHSHISQSSLVSKNYGRTHHSGRTFWEDMHAPCDVIFFLVCFDGTVPASFHQSPASASPSDSSLVLADSGANLVHLYILLNHGENPRCGLSLPKIKSLWKLDLWIKAASLVLKSTLIAVSKFNVHGDFMDFFYGISGNFMGKTCRFHG